MKEDPRQFRLQSPQKEFSKDSPGIQKLLNEISNEQKFTPNSLRSNSESPNIARLFGGGDMNSLNQHQSPQQLLFQNNYNSTQSSGSMQPKDASVSSFSSRNSNRTNQIEHQV